MDFHAEFEKTMARFPGLEGLIFVDPDGENILFNARNMDTFDVQLAGARMPIMHQHYRLMGDNNSPAMMELVFRKRYIISVWLKQCYSITAIGRSVKERAHLKDYLRDMAVQFNEEIP